MFISISIKRFSHFNSYFSSDLVNHFIEKGLTNLNDKVISAS